MFRRAHSASWPAVAATVSAPPPGVSAERALPEHVALGDDADAAVQIAYPVVMRRVTRTFGDLTAIDGISLTIPAGTILGVIGPSGSGKTTTVRALTGALEPTSGEVRVLGEDPRHFSRQARESIGYMPQSFVLYPDLTASENVHFVGALFGMLRRRRQIRVREALELVELWDARDRRASQLSGGMQRRLELACTLVHEPALLFLDEPTAGLDPLLRQEVWDELRRLRASGRTLLVTTQYVGEAEYCDAVALIAQGKLIALAPPEDLRRQALGGDVLEVEFAEPFDARRLRGADGVTSVDQRSPTEALITLDDAGSGSIRLVETVTALGGDVSSSREYRPSFDDVFATLVSRDLQATADGAAVRNGTGAA